MIKYDKMSAGVCPVEKYIYLECMKKVSGPFHSWIFPPLSSKFGAPIIYGSEDSLGDGGSAGCSN